MASTALAVKTALTSTLTTKLPDMTVTWGVPTRDPGRRWAVAGRVKWEESEWVTNRSKDERYSVHVVLGVNLVGGSVKDAETDVMSLVQTLETALIATPTLGVPRVISTSFVPGELSSGINDQSVGAVFECELMVHARV